jgi:iron complex transport system ATP-binding protein
MLKVDNLSFEYNSVPVLKDFSFKVEKGSLCGLFGPNVPERQLCSSAV